jgi:uncharacterized protein
MKTLEEIKEVINLNKDLIYNRYQINEIGIFGSYVHGKQNNKSDIDILVEYREIPDLIKFINFEIFLEELLDTKVDLVRKSSIRKELKDNILRETIYL